MNPSPLRERWQPVRGGLVNLFKYEDQVFRYENGHLLLRGDNGSGKSRVLALQLPFLLDGDLSPYRVEPDRDPAKKMEWHLLMDGKYERRTGYSWIEFGRVDEDGTEHWCSLGCGMEAKKGGGAPDRWFFVSPRRVGEALALVRNNTPLSKRQLADFFAEAEGTAGEIFSTRASYRAAVDAALFRLGSRYDPLIDLLIQLRQPQLMRDMREDALSDALSEALSPVNERLIAEVAESFQGLDTDRQRTDEYRDMLESVETFRDEYRQYLAVAVRRLCSVVRTGHSQFEHAARELREIEEQSFATAATLAESKSARELSATRLASLSAEAAALRESPEMRDKQELDRAQTRAEECRNEAETAQRDAELAAIDFERETRDREQRETELTSAKEGFFIQHRELRQAHQPLATRGELLFDPETADAAAAERDSSAFVETHHKNLRHLGERNAEVEKERHRHERVREQCERTREQFAETEESVVAGEGRLESEIEKFGQLATSWESTLKELTEEHFPRGVEWTDALAEWLESREETFVFSRDLTLAGRRAQDGLSAETARLEASRVDLEVEREKWESERDQLREGRQPEPPAPRTREPRPESRPGAPFWRWFEFRREIPGDEHAGWEAALESAGLLDAWIYPDGRMDGGDEADAFLGLSGDPELTPADSLGAILQPTDEAGDELGGLLRRIGNHRNASRCWVARDGSWANGPHHGRWEKSAAEFLGHRAREQARQRRLTELEGILSELRERLAALDADLVSLNERKAVLESEIAAAPSTREAETAAIALSQFRESAGKQKRELIEAEERLVSAQRSFEESVARRDGDAADLGMSEWVEADALARFAEHLADFEKRAVAFWPAWRRILELGKERDRAQDREAAARTIKEEREERFREKRDLAEQTRSRAETLLSTVGAAVEEIVRRLEIADTEVNQARSELDAHEAAIRKAETDEAVLEEKQRTARERRQSAEDSRNRAVDRMGDFVTHRLFEELDPASQPDRETFSATAAVDLARRFERELKEHPESDEHWNRLQNAIGERFSEFSDQLGRHGPYPKMDRIDESSVCVIRGEFQGKERTVGEMHRVLSEELANRQRIFEEEERKVIENHLIDEAAVAVRDRIRDGDDWVRNVNEELARVPTSSGIHLKFEWRLADPDDTNLKSVREMFRKHAATWSLAEREEIGSFLQSRIQFSREEDDSRTWRDHLQHALDYRGWHRFGILRKQGSDEGWKRLTKRTFGTGSGGEKALTLTVPQFAAAAAHYHSAHRHAPRLILLDEVFVGIDANTRARLMGLLETFDLDYVMTSEREWGAFPTVSALAIYQLATRPGFNAVAVTRWVWNGKEQRRDESADEESSTVPVTDLVESQQS